MKRYPNWGLRNQSGAALLFSLIFLLLLTIIGMTAMQSSTLQERMAGNTRDINLAFQAAEVGLRAGEAVMGGASPPVVQTTGPYRMAVTDPSLAATWADPTTGLFANTANSTLTTTTLSGIDAANNPRYIVEEIQTTGAAAATGSGIDVDSGGGAAMYIVYRITSRGLGSTGKTTVILQSTFKPKF